jgi:tyrosine-protein kinase Etk/Wzc
MLNIPDSMHKEKKLPNMAFLLNDTDVTKGYGYGYGYGNYGYGNTPEKKPWYKKVFKK